GVARSLEIIRTELDTTMALCGHRDIRAVDRSILWTPSAQTTRDDAPAARRIAS
ncbi:alpha-hydroxy-acid oxidizing protein, partial [Marinobacter adhaerens]|uniref:alpha-hydroxy-acid oxidizing protein n=2 Tax=Pseudomonadota TaxID=1224 RepID=UPI001C5E7A5F